MNKRAYKRFRYCVPVVVSYFNKNHLVNAQVLNHGSGGICFKSSTLLQSGATVYIRVKKFQPNGPSNDDCQGLRSVTLAEIKWCKEFFNETETLYEMGAKYYAPEH